MHVHPLIRLLWCLVGSAVGIGSALFLAGPQINPFLLASLGGTTVFLFGLTRAPAAQPRAVFGGHLGGALSGIACYQFFGESLAVYALATALALAFMLLTRTVHPPAGANPVLMVYVHASWAALWQPVLVGVGALVLVAFLWSRLYPGLVHYPTQPLAPSPPHLNWGGWGTYDA
jgi:CBS-domain-containing membrane protein